jgi:peptidoglycan/LPS O-acetylase OafA/YrhL
MVLSAISAVAGAIMYWGVTAASSSAAQQHGFRLSTLGIILMVAGAVGCALAFLLPQVHAPTERDWRQLLKGAALVGAALILVLFRFAAARDLSTLGFCMALCVLATSYIVFIQITMPVRLLEVTLESKPAKWIGKRSYGLYVWHYPIYQILFTFPFIVGHHLLYGAPLCFLASFVVAALSYKYLEQPVLHRWKGRFQRTEGLPSTPPLAGEMPHSSEG